MFDLKKKQQLHTGVSRELGREPVEDPILGGSAGEAVRYDVPADKHDRQREFERGIDSVKWS